jgi:hypothetical protein
MNYVLQVYLPPEKPDLGVYLRTLLAHLGFHSVRPQLTDTYIIVPEHKLAFVEDTVLEEGGRLVIHAAHEYLRA